MVSKSNGHLEVSIYDDSVSIHKWFHDAGRFMSFTREEAKVVSALLQEVLHNDQLLGDASPHSERPSVLPE